MIYLANPTARSGRGQKLQAFWRYKLSEVDLKRLWHQCLSGEDCRYQASIANQTVAAVGGDGTINNVINGLMANDSQPSMAVLYSGTSPDFCKFHQIPLQPQEAWALLLAGQSKKIDVGEVTFDQEKSSRHKAFFASSCNIGLGATTAEFANRWRKYLGDIMGTGLGLFKAMALHKTFKSEIVIDGQHYRFGKTNHIIVLKNPYIASSLHLDLNCQVDDGYLWVIVIHDYSRIKLLSLISAMYQGSLLNRKNIFVKSGRHINVITNPIQSLEFDGDPHGQTPAYIEIKPKALSLICGGIRD